MLTIISRRNRGVVLGLRCVVAAVAWGAMLTLAGGCQNTPPDAKTQNIDTYQHAIQQMTNARAQVGNTLAALDKYCQKPSGETYGTFVAQIQETQRQADDIRDTSAKMHDLGDTYFASWDAELASMTNADLKRQSASQKEATQQAYRQIAAQAPNVRAAYEKFMDDLRNLRTYFDKDKTASGVASASSLIAKTNADGAELQRQIDQETANLSQVQGMFNSMKNGAAGAGQ